MDAAQWWGQAGSLTALAPAAAVVSAVVAAVAARQAHAAAREANAAAGTMAEIERERFRQESAPVFRLRCDAGVPQPGFALLSVQLSAGPQLVLDSVQVTIVSLVDIRPWNLTASDAAEAEEAVWAGWQFNTFFGPLEGRAASPRQSRPRRYSRADGKDFEQLMLRETMPPARSGMTREQWRDYWQNLRLRLQLECRVGGGEPWVIFYNVEVGHPDSAKAGSNN